MPMIFALRLSASICRSIFRDLHVGHGSARGKTMRGGFTFKLSNGAGGRHSSPPSQCAGFADSIRASAEAAQTRQDNGSERIEPRSRRGSFIDLKTIARGVAQPIVQSRVACRLPQNTNSQSRKRRTWKAIE